MWPAVPFQNPLPGKHFSLWSPLIWSVLCLYMDSENHSILLPSPRKHKPHHWISVPRFTPMSYDRWCPSSVLLCECFSGWCVSFQRLMATCLEKDLVTAIPLVMSNINFLGNVTVNHVPVLPLGKTVSPIMTQWITNHQNNSDQKSKGSNDMLQIWRN